MLGLLLHLMVDALVELGETPVLVLTRMDEVLIARGQLPFEQELEVVDDFDMALHGEILGAANEWVNARPITRPGQAKSTTPP